MRFRVTLDVPPLMLDVEEVWPDGDAPDAPTVDDVLDELRRGGWPWRVAPEWGFDAAWEVEVET